MQAASSSDSVAKDVAAAFVQFDTGSKGFLTRHELRAVYISLLGHAPSKVSRQENRCAHSTAQRCVQFAR